MCDIAVITDIPNSLINLPSIPDDQVYPSPILSVLTDLDFCDLANPIIGSQVHKQSDTIQWVDRSITILPCIMKDSINICKEDTYVVLFFALLSESLPMTSQNAVHLQYSNWHFRSWQLCDKISTVLHINKAIIIWQVSKSEPTTLNLDRINLLLTALLVTKSTWTTLSYICRPTYWTNPHHNSDSSITVI
jgi:hypothetical protein